MIWSGDRTKSGVFLEGLAGARFSGLVKILPVLYLNTLYWAPYSFTELNFGVVSVLRDFGTGYCSFRDTKSFNFVASTNESDVIAIFSSSTTFSD